MSGNEGNGFYGTNPVDFYQPNLLLGDDAAQAVPHMTAYQYRWHYLPKEATFDHDPATEGRSGVVVIYVGSLADFHKLLARWNQANPAMWRYEPV